MTNFIYPTEEPTFELIHNPDCAEAYRAFCVIEAMVQYNDAEQHGYIFHSGNGGYNIDNECFRLHAHDYSDDDITWNFIYKDIAIQWYKHRSRILHINRIPTSLELQKMVQDVSKALLDETLTLDDAAELIRMVDIVDFASRMVSIKPRPPMTAEQKQRLADKIQWNGQYGSFGRVDGLQWAKSIQQNSIYGSMGNGPGKHDNTK